MPMREEKILMNLRKEFQKAEITKKSKLHGQMYKAEALVWPKDGKAYQRLRIEQTSPHDANIYVQQGEAPPALHSKIQRLEQMDWN